MSFSPRPATTGENVSLTVLCSNYILQFSITNLFSEHFSVHEHDLNVHTIIYGIINFPSFSFPILC